jgi:DNA-binding response OmpR family regulator
MRAAQDGGMRILLVEDDVRLARAIRQALAESGYAVDVEHDAASALTHVEIDPPDLLITDLRLPGLDGGGFALCAAVRRASLSLPILMLTAIDSPAAKVKGLDVGADDYLTKPFHLEELRARVRALLRRSPQSLPTTLEAGSVTLDPATRTATRSGTPIDLTAKEFAVLEYLMRRPGVVVSTSELIDHAWDRNYEGYSNVVPTYIRYLRQKLAIEGLPDPIVTHRGAGYSIAAGS